MSSVTQLEDVVAHLERYKAMQTAYYGEWGARSVYILHSGHEEFANHWDDALRRLLPKTAENGGIADNWRELVEPMIPVLSTAQLADYIADHGESIDFMVFACDLADVLKRQWSMLHARRRTSSVLVNAQIRRPRLALPRLGRHSVPSLAQ